INKAPIAIVRGLTGSGYDSREAILAFSRFLCKKVFA
nr:hypothetical protein [Tanacetum cinerariifolium]